MGWRSIKIYVVPLVKHKNDTMHIARRELEVIFCARYKQWEWRVMVIKLLRGSSGAKEEIEFVNFSLCNWNYDSFSKFSQAQRILISSINKISLNAMTTIQLSILPSFTSISLLFSLMKMGKTFPFSASAFFPSSSSIVSSWSRLMDP